MKLLTERAVGSGHAPATTTSLALIVQLALACSPVWAYAQDGAQAAQPKPTHDEELRHAKQCFAAARTAYAAGKLAEARDGFTCAFELAPSPELEWNLARVYERMGDANQGIRFYLLYLDSSALKAEERVSIERRVAALEELRDRQRQQVKGQLPSERELGSEARAFFDRGVKLYHRGNYVAALVAFAAALRASGAPELHYNLAVASERLHKPSDALDHFRAYLAAKPDADDKADVETRIAALRAQLP